MSPYHKQIVTLPQRGKVVLYVSMVLIILVAWFGSLELRGLFIPDEGRYAEIPREMLASGDWITPRQNDLKYFEKPPLQYWMTAVSYRLFGEDEWTARLPSTLFGFFAVLMAGFTGYRLWGLQAGLATAAILGGSWAFFLAGQYLTLDMTLTACMTFSLCSFLLAQREGTTPSSHGWILVAWVATALAVLSKGLVGIVLPALSLFAYIAIRRETALLKRMRPLAGGALFLLIASPWFIAVQYRNPEFFKFFFVHEHFQRFAESGHNRPGVWWYYLPIMILGLMPWTPVLLKTGIDWLREQHPRVSGFSPALFCVLWATVIVMFFSASHSKLPAYVVPAFPAVALAIASRIQTRSTDSLKWAAYGVSLVGILFLVLTALLPGTAKFSALGSDAIRQIPQLYWAEGILIASGIAALLSARGGRFATTGVILMFGTFAFWQLVFDFLYDIDASLSSERLIERLTENRRPFHPELPFFSIAQYDESVPFYLGRTVTLVNHIGELGPGIDAEPEKAIPTVEQFERIWLAQKGQAYAIMRPQEFDQLRQAGLPMAAVVSDKRLAVVSRWVDDN